MSLARRLQQLEERAPAPPPTEVWMSEHATVEDVVREVVAHVRHRWEFCRSCTVHHVDNLCRGSKRNEPDPDGRWSWATWRPSRPAGVLPERADLFLRVLPDPAVPWVWRNLPLPADLSAADDEAEVCDVWSGHVLCRVWEWRVFEATLEEVGPGYLLAIKPRHRPQDWDHGTGQYAARSALARYVQEPEDADAAWSWSSHSGRRFAPPAT